MEKSKATKRVEDFRKRKAQEGLKEVRNIWAKPEHHEQIKRFAEQLNKPA